MSKKQVFAKSFRVFDANVELPGFFVIGKLDPDVEIHDEVQVYLGPYDSEEEAEDVSNDLPEDSQTMWMPGIDDGAGLH